MQFKPVEQDDDVERALQWFMQVSDDPLALAERIHSAQAHYCEVTHAIAGPLSRMDIATTYGDTIALYLAQAVALLRDRRTYDLHLGSQVVPLIKTIGANLDVIKRIGGASGRARRMLRPRAQHPDGALFELVAAIRYARDGDLAVEFIPEQANRTADFRASGRGGEIHVECKRLRKSQYELTEDDFASKLFAPFSRMAHEKKLSVAIDVSFTVELRHVPEAYLVDRVHAITRSPLFIPGSYPWKDKFGEGELWFSDLDAVHKDIADSSLLLGPKMARLLTGRPVPDSNFHLSCGGVPRAVDTRFIDSLEYGSAILWRCNASASVEARARHIRTKLAEIDQQMANAPLGIAHIGMDSERGENAADLRRERNKEAARSFQPKSRLVEVILHYFLPRVSESSSWMIDETVDSFRGAPTSILGDSPSLLAGTREGLIDQAPAWRQPPPI
jgi:hypothetical protein